MEILSHVDHTQLKTFATYDDVKALCEEAVKYKTASVCIPPAYIACVKKDFPELNICTVIGFPLGYSTTATKVFETKDAITNGANEIDMVINIGATKAHQYDLVRDEISAIKEACGDKTLKVIIEACYLSDEEKIELCRIITETGADYIKTSTGFGTGGATIEDIRLFKQHIGPNVKMKAAGGIRTIEDMEAYLNEGCDRLGCSAAVKLLK